MLNPDEKNAQRIARWSSRNPGAFAAVTTACGDLADASAEASADPSPANIAHLHQCGRDLTQACNAELSGSRSGVSDYDTPRKEALRYWARAGEAAARFDPTDEANDDSLDAAALLTKGTEVNAVATQYARRLRDKFAA